MSQHFRPEIQGLRAVAVLVVLLFHVWPTLVSGGYVGVDVFFVISGYLITGLLLKEVDATGRISVLNFYERRVRRLLPAASAVMIAVALCLQFVPSVRWGDVGEQIFASAFYYQNWWLGVQAVDYLNAENAPGPLQHFWSLSIEEQYYLLWPVVFGGLAFLVRGRRIPLRRVFIWMIAAVFIASLAYAIYITPRNPGWAYFATTSRAWELALGGWLATVPSAWQSRLGTKSMVAMAAAGSLGILVSAMLYTNQTAFPGYAALMPTIGAALVILGTSGSARNWVRQALSVRPMQYLGDISYSLYLWHWLVVVYGKNILGVEEFSVTEGVIVCGLSLALAHFSKTMIEDRWRRPVPGARWRALVLTVVCLASSVLAGLWVFHEVKQGYGRGSTAVVSQAAASSAFTPSVEVAESDKGRVYSLGCITTTMGTDVHRCEMQSNLGGKNVVVVGDSHAAAWLPAIEAIAVERRWNLSAVIKSACPFALFPEDVANQVTLDTMKTCIEWEAKAVPFVGALNPDLIITAHSVSSMSRTEGDATSDVVATAVVEAWKAVQKPGVDVVAILDTPRFLSKVPECMAMSASNPARCGRERDAAIARRDPLRQAVALFPEAKLIDLNDEICSPTRCEPVVRGMLAWRDAHHMTNTFASSLASSFGAELDKATSNRHK